MLQGYVDVNTPQSAKENTLLGPNSSILVWTTERHEQILQYCFRNHVVSDTFLRGGQYFTEKTRRNLILRVWCRINSKWAYKRERLPELRSECVRETESEILVPRKNRFCRVQESIQILNQSFLILFPERK